MKKSTFSQQSFSFDVQYILNLIKTIQETGRSTQEISKALGIGKPKARCFMQYAKISRVLNEDSEITNFGKQISKIKYDVDYLYSLLYYQLVRGEENGGHFFFSKIVNDILYDISFALDNKIALNEIKQKMLEFNKKELEQKKYFSYISSAINTLSNPNAGFGKLGIVKKEGDEYEVYSYWPKPLVCAYIIYDQWREGSVAMKINDIVEGHYNLGRIFYLDEETVMGILETLKQRSYLSIETIAGLNQIRINPDISKEDILEEIVKDA